MAHKKKEYYKPGPMTEGKRNIIQIRYNKLRKLNRG